MERGFELILGYDAPGFMGQGQSEVRVGYKNISGGSWLIRKDECLLWLTDVSNRCGQYTNVWDSFFWVHQGGWYGTSSGEVVLDPNAK